METECNHKFIKLGPGIKANRPYVKPKQKRTPFIYSRGNTDGPTLDGKELDSIHYFPDFDKKQSGKPVCNNGAWNIRHTARKPSVTCNACLKKIEGGSI